MKNIFFIALFAILFFKSRSNTTQPGNPVPVHDTFNIQFKMLGEKRIINVWTPERYSKSTDSLPVMYMADRGVKEDFPQNLLNQRKFRQ